MMRIRLCFTTCLVFFFTSVLAQNAPVTTVTTVNNGVSGQVVMVPVTVAGFNNIGSFALTLDYDYSKLHFISGTQNPLLSGTLYLGDNDLGNGNHRIVFGWYGTGTTLPEGTWIVNISFTYITGTAHLEWYDNGPSCEYTNENATILNDVPLSVYYINGLICGNLQPPGNITGLSSVCKGQTAVSYSVSPIPNVTGYQWTVPPGSFIVNGYNTNSVTVDFSVTAVSGDISVNGLNECGNGPISVLPVTVQTLPVANAGNDTIIFSGTSAYLHAANGGTGFFGYHWSPENLLLNPDVQNVQTVQLTSSTIFDLLVTNLSTGCTSNDHITVTISGGVLSTNPTVIPGIICRTSFAQLFANAGGGSGYYTYFWTCCPPGNPPWTSTQANPMVNPDSTKHYMLTVNDGYSTTTGSTDLVVNQLPTAFISGGDSLCNDGSVASLQVDLTGTPPWTFTYSNGITANTISNQTTTPYFIITSVPGVYTILSVYDENCSGITNGTASVVVSPVPEPPVIIQSGNSLISNYILGNQWYRNQELIPGATEQYFTPVENGNYYDVVTLNDCSSDSSNNISVTITDDGKNISGAIHVYPNPVNDYLYIRGTGLPGEIISVQIFSSCGRVLRRDDFTGRPFNKEFRMELLNYQRGIYFLKIETKRESLIYKIILI